MRCALLLLALLAAEAAGPTLTHLPVLGMSERDLKDTFNDARGGARHEAIDIAAPRGTAVLAVTDGAIRKLFLSGPGGLTIYQFDLKEKYCFYYAHLDGYAPGLREGQLVRSGQIIGFVGTTGNAPPGAPHLHFTVFRLGADKRWWEGEALNPYPYLLNVLRRGGAAHRPSGRGRAAACPGQAGRGRPR